MGFRPSNQFQFVQQQAPQQVQTFQPTTVCNYVCLEQSFVMFLMIGTVNGVPDIDTISLAMIVIVKTCAFRSLLLQDKNILCFLPILKSL